MNQHDKRVLDCIRERGPIEAAHIADMLKMDEVGVYTALAALDAKRMAVMVRAEKGGTNARREWEAA